MDVDSINVKNIDMWNNGNMSLLIVIVSLENEENVTYYLMWWMQITRNLVQPYEDGKFTYQIGVVMGHFFEKMKR